MPRRAFQVGLNLLFLAIALAWPVTATAQASEEAAIKAYVLDTAKVKSFIAANEAILAARKADRSLVEEIEAMGDEPSETISESRAMLKRHPRVLGFYQKAGLSLDDAVLLPRALFTAAAAAEFPTASDLATPAQVAFVKQNRELMDRLRVVNETFNDEADDDQDGDEPDEACR